MWKSVFEELKAFQGLLVGMCASWTTRWHPTVYSSDASEKGWAVARRDLRSSEAAAIGRVLERSRFRVENSVNARQHAFGAAGLAFDVKGELGIKEKG